MSGRNTDHMSLDAAALRVIETVLPLFEEATTVSKHVRRTRVAARRTLAVRREDISADLVHGRVVVEHLPVGRIVDAAQPVRVEDGVTIIPVIVEQAVVMRRLFTKEESRIWQVRGVSRHAEPSSCAGTRRP